VADSLDLEVELDRGELALLIHGVTMSLFTLIWINTLQEQVPRELIGRVVSVDILGSFAFLPIGYGVAG
jgi:hypothetical protein